MTAAIRDATARGLTVLVAEDDPSFGRLLASRLTAVRGIGEVIRAVDGAEAVQFGLQRRPDVAVLDVGLPRLGGLEAATTLRGLRPSMQIVVQTADARAHAERADLLGFHLFDKVELDGLVAWVEACARAPEPVA
jgi:CheY-like chemotaxis protein